MKQFVTRKTILIIHYLKHISNPLVWNCQNILKKLSITTAKMNFTLTWSHRLVGATQRCSSGLNSEGNPEVLPLRRRKRCTRGPGGCGGTTPGGRRADACLWRSLRRDSRRTWNGREAEIKTLLWLDRIGEGGIRTHDVLINRRLLYHSVKNHSSKINWGRRFLSLELSIEQGR